mgnify:CR=1 FL=1|jgi:hypothetical protein
MTIEETLGILRERLNKIQPFLQSFEGNQCLVVAATKLTDVSGIQDKTQRDYDIFPVVFKALKHLMWYEAQVLNKQESTSTPEQYKVLLDLNNIFREFMAFAETFDYVDMTV